MVALALRGRGWDPPAPQPASHDNSSGKPGRQEEILIQEVFRIGSFAISPFGLLMALAFLSAYAQLRWGLQQAGAGDVEDAGAIVFAGGVGGVLGSKIYYAILYRDPSLLLERYGLVWYGGLILGTLAVILVIYRRKLPPWKAADASVVAMAIGYAVGRVGCFLVGDDYGVPTTVPWGVRFPVGLPPSTAGNLRSIFGVEVPATVPNSELLAVHPTQIYEVVACVLIWILGVWWLRRSPKPGVVTFAIGSLLAMERFLVEFLRAKDDRFFGALTLAQVISVAVLGMIMLLWMRRRRSDGASSAEIA